MSQPEGLVLVLDDGTKIKADVRFRGRELMSDGKPGRVFEPVIEGDLAVLMPRVVRVELDVMPPRTSVAFPPASHEIAFVAHDQEPGDPNVLVVRE